MADDKPSRDTAKQHSRNSTWVMWFVVIAAVSAFIAAVSAVVAVYPTILGAAHP
jgi:hypothetical protein